MGVRTFRAEDIPAVVALRRRCFSHSAHECDAALGDHFHRLFFAAPWQHDRIRPLVFDARRRIVGFLGVFPRPFLLDTERLWAAVWTQFMTDPEHRGTCAEQLLAAMLAGDQDLSYADLATSAARRVWMRIGGQTALLQSLYWTVPIDPAHHLADQARRLGVNPWLMRAFRPFVRAAASTAMIDSSDRESTRDDWQATALDVPTWATLLDDLGASYSLRPEISEGALRWMLDCLSAGLRHREQLIIRMLTDQRGHTRGWYAFVARPGGIAQCLQIHAATENLSRVLATLIADARSHRCTMLRGRVQPEHLDALATPPSYLDRGGPYTLFHARRQPIGQMLADGSAWFTRLEGEYWMNF